MILLQSAGISLTPTKTLVALFIPLLLVIPGVAGLQVSLWTARRRDTFSQLEKLVLSALISLGSLVILYSGGSIVLWKILDYEAISSFSLFEVVCGYVLHFVTAVAVGVLAGSFAYNYYLGNRPSSMYDSWEYLFNLRNEGDDIKIRTVSGIWLKGHVHQVVENGTSRDLLLDNVEVFVPTSEEAIGDQEPDPSSSLPDLEDGEQETINEEDSLEEIEAKLDFQIEDDYSLEDSNSTKRLKYLHLEGSEIEAIGQETEIIEGFDEEIDAKDRLQRRTGSIASVFGYGTIEDWLGTQFERANSGWGRLLFSLTLLLTLWTALVSPTRIGEFTEIPPTFLISFITIITLTFGYAELLQYDIDFPSSYLENFLSLLLLGAILIIISGGVILYATQYPVRLLFGGIFAGVLGAIPVSFVVNQIRYRYTKIVSLTITVIILAGIGIAVPYTTGYGLPQAYGQTIIGLGVGAGIVLFIERIRIGQPEPFQEWPRVLADILATAFAILGAVMFIRGVSGLLEVSSISVGGTVFNFVGAGIFVLLTIGYGGKIQGD